MAQNDGQTLGIIILQISVVKTKAETTFLKGCKESEMFCEAGLHKGDFVSSGTDERNDGKQVVAQLTVKMTEALRHLVDEGITQLTTHTVFALSKSDNILQYITIPSIRIKTCNDNTVMSMNILKYHGKLLPNFS